MKYTIKDVNIFPKDTGIYKIHFTNSKNDKVYIGSASGKSGFYNRWKSHISSLKNNKSGNKILQSASNKYDINNIVFEIIEICDSNICLIREQFNIDKYDSYNFGYNARPIASNNGGLSMSVDTKEKISNRWKLKRDLYSDEVRNLYILERKTTREICKILNIGRNFLSKIFRENNIEPRKESGKKKRKVYQYKNGDLVHEWESFNDCTKKQSLNTNGVRLVLKDKCISYKGFYFSYEKLDKKTIIEIENQFKINSKCRKYYYIN